MSSWDEFTEDTKSMIEFDQEHYRRLIPIIGAGFNRHIFEANEITPAAYSWLELLKNIIVEFELDTCPTSLPQGYIGIWEKLVLQYAEQKSIQANKAEREIQKYVAQFLRENVEQLSVQMSLPNKKMFENLRFLDIISLNFDRIFTPRQKCLQPSETVGDSNWSQYSQIGKKGIHTRIWYPHGHVGAYNTLHLGVRKYGLRIKTLEEARKKFESKRIQPRISSTSWRSNSNDHVRKNTWNWYSMAINAPIVLLGVGLSPDEWIQWWFLHTRARNHVRASNRPKVYRLTCEQDNINEANNIWQEYTGAQLTLLDGGKTWDEAWNKFYDCFK